MYNRSTRLSGERKEKTAIMRSSDNHVTVHNWNETNDWSPGSYQGDVDVDVDDDEDVEDNNGNVGRWQVSTFHSSSLHRSSDKGIKSGKRQSETEFRSAVFAVKESLDAIQTVLMEHHTLLEEYE